MPVLTTRRQMRHTRESARRVAFEPGVSFSFPGAFTPTTWDATTAVNTSLTNNDQTVTNMEYCAIQGVWSNSPQSSGSYYVEVTCTEASTAPVVPGPSGALLVPYDLGTISAAGYLNSEAPFPLGGHYGTANGGNFGAIIDQPTLIYSNQSQYPNPLPGPVVASGLHTGDVIGLAVSASRYFDSMSVYWRIVGGPDYAPSNEWNGYNFALWGPPDAYPTTGQGAVGAALNSTFYANVIAMAFATNDVNQSMTFNFGASSFVGTVPPTYVAGWGSTTVNADPYWQFVTCLCGLSADVPHPDASTMNYEEGPFYTGQQGMGTGSAPCVFSTAVVKFPPASISISPGQAGLYLGGNSADGTLARQFNLANFKFTLECWVYTNTITGTSDLFDGSSCYKLQRVNATLVWTVSTTGSNSFVDITTGNVLAAGSWHAVCIEFDGIKYRLYVDGVMVGSSTILRTFYWSNAVFILGGSGSSLWNGYLSEFRLTKGIARYASDSGYTPSTTRFPRPVPGGDPYWSDVVLLMGFNNIPPTGTAQGLNDEGPHAHGTATAGGQAKCIQGAAFPPTALHPCWTAGPGWVTYPSNADWQFGSGAFTVECWVLPEDQTGFPALTGIQAIIGVWSAAPNNSWVLYTNGAVLHWDVSTTGSDDNADLSSGSVTLSTGSWYHVAVDYDGSKYRMYLNGAVVATSSAARNIYPAATPLTIAAYAGGVSSFWTGAIDELRITKGLARYATDVGFARPLAFFPRTSVAGFVYPTLDPATLVKAALSNGNLTVQATEPAIPEQGVFGPVWTAGKHYFTVRCDAQLDYDSTFGVASPGADFNALALNGTGGAVLNSGGYIMAAGNTEAGYVTGSVRPTDLYGVAVDVDNSLIWFTGLAGPDADHLWNGMAGNDPVTGVGGVPIPSGPVAPVATFGGFIYSTPDGPGNIFTIGDGVGPWGP